MLFAIKSSTAFCDVNYAWCYIVLFGTFPHACSLTIKDVIALFVVPKSMPINIKTPQINYFSAKITVPWCTIFPLDVIMAGSIVCFTNKSSVDVNSSAFSGVIGKPSL